MKQPKWEVSLEQLVEDNDVDAIEARLDNADRLKNEYEALCKTVAQEQIDKLKNQLNEKEATISALLKCIRILGGD